MNRRSFLKWMGVGTAAVAVAPSVIASCGDPWCGSIAGEGIIPHDELHDEKAPVDAVIAGYNGYVNFSSLAIAAAIDPEVEQAAAELSKEYGQRIENLQRHLL